MALIDYNKQGSRPRTRRLLLTGQETTLPAPIARWLLAQRAYAHLFTIQPV